MNPFPHGPHAAYVEAAYAVSAAGLALATLASLVRAATWRRRAERAGRR